MREKERYETIKREMSQIRGFKCLSFDLRQSVLDWYATELRAIERMKCCNPHPNTSIVWKYD